MLSLDEASLNITTYCVNTGKDPLAVAGLIKDDVDRETSLTCSIGIAPTNTLAKICAEVKKPNGVFMLQPDRDTIVEFMSGLPLRKVPGVGKVMGRLLEELGVTGCGQLREAREALFQLFPAATCRWFASIWLGLVSSRTQRGRVRKSVSREHTLSGDDNEPREACTTLCRGVADELAMLHMRCRALTVKVKTIDYEVLTVSAVLDPPVCSAEDLLRQALLLLDELASRPGLVVRTVGVRVTDLCGDSTDDDGSKALTVAEANAGTPSPALSPDRQPPARRRGRPKKVEQQQ
eukprot:TRINITY_DN6088_c0_g1_i2.p1 TRINITY_DN6088_c0_g1~~TRINITY_DN6088_c0_g1_i2.p1  ORF type:complete len:292 (-),score=64.64 TRINITY_DN6088_c0_g1_i2:28-903(-)